MGLAGSFVYVRIKAAPQSTFLLSDVGLLQTAAYTLGTTPLPWPTWPAWRSPGQYGSGQRVLSWFVPLGRMALTVCLTQSMVQLAVFSSHGAGLAGQVSFVWLPVVALAIISGQRALLRLVAARARAGSGRMAVAATDLRSESDWRRDPSPAAHHLRAAAHRRVVAIGGIRCVPPGRDTRCCNRMPVRTAVATAAGVVAFGLAAQAQPAFPPPETPREVAAMRTSGQVRVDGVLDEADWQRAAGQRLRAGRTAALRAGD